MDMIRSRTSGFTLVELIIVIILVAIVSVYAISRYVGQDSFAAFVAQEQVISVIRQVQVNRMQSNVEVVSGNTNFTLAIQSDCIGSQNACASRSETRSDWVSMDGLTFSTSPTLNLVDFDLLGNPTGLTGSSIDITIQSISEQCIVTINAQGYVSQGGCS